MDQLGPWKDPNSKSTEAIIPLIYALQDSKDAVRGNAAWALGRIGDSSAIDPPIDAWDRIDTLYPPEKGPTFWNRKCVNGFRNALCDLTGQKIGFDLAAWKKWRTEDVKKQEDAKKQAEKDK